MIKRYICTTCKESCELIVNLRYNVSPHFMPHKCPYSPHGGANWVLMEVRE